MYTYESILQEMTLFAESVVEITKKTHGVDMIFLETYFKDTDNIINGKVMVLKENTEEFLRFLVKFLSISTNVSSKLSFDIFKASNDISVSKNDILERECVAEIVRKYFLSITQYWVDVFHEITPLI